jgi:pimeloyl-ACP methyl ester carboxylesterase
VEQGRGRSGQDPGTILFVHGSSMASQPTFDLDVPGRPDSSAWSTSPSRATTAGASTWRATAAPPRTATTTRRSRSAPTIATAAAEYIAKLRGPRPLLVYGISSGALRAALFTERHPEMVDRLALDAHVWTVEGSPTLHERRKKLPEFQSRNRRPINRDFVFSIFNRDHPGTAEDSVISAFADAILKLDDSVPTGTYVDMCSRLPVVKPGEHQGTDDRDARPVGRDRELR